MRRLLAAALLALAAGGPADGAAAQEVTLSLGEARGVAVQALAQGDPVLAATLARGLLEADPADSQALTILSVASGLTGDTGGALDYGRRAWAAADTPIERFDAASATARALAARGAYTRAQVWLRRSAQAAPSAEARAEAEANFRWTRAANPLSLQFSLSVAPSSNVNAGSSSRFVTLFGLPFELGADQRALSGTSAVAEASLGYRLPQADPRIGTELTVSAVGRGVALSSGARRDAPRASGSDYGYAAVEVGLRHRIVPGDAPVAWTLETVAGRNWSGGDLLSDFQRVEGGVETPLGDDGLLRLALTVERQDRRDDPRRSADVVAFQGDVVRRLASGDRLSARATVRRTWSDGFDIGNVSVSARLGWERGRAVTGVGLGAGITGGWQRFDLSPLAPGGDRRDRTLGADVTLTLERLDYMGFAPTVTLSASRTRSTLAIYDREDLGFAVGFRSSF